MYSGDTDKHNGGRYVCMTNTKRCECKTAKTNNGRYYVYVAKKPPQTMCFSKRNIGDTLCAIQRNVTKQVNSIHRRKKAVIHL